MKKYLLLTLPLLLCAAKPAEPQPCTKSSESCAQSTGPVSPFVAASRAATAPAPAAAAAKTPSKPAVKPAAKVADAAAPAAVEVSSPAAPAPAAPAAPAHSSPLWIIVGAGLPVALYFYLGAGRKGRK